MLVKWTWWGFLALLGSLAFLLLYLIDMDRKASVERLYYMQLPPHSAFPELQLGRRCSYYGTAKGVDQLRQS
jgi:hypothetical protein